MKKVIQYLFATAALVAGIVFVNSSDTLAQGRTRVGIKGGLNASSLFYDSQGATNKNERIGYHVGVFAQAPIGEFLLFSRSYLYDKRSIGRL